MKIQCHHCHAVYSIPDEKLPSKVKKVKCRKCDGVMVIPPRKEKAKTDVDTPKSVTRVNESVETVESKNETSEEKEKQGFSWLTFFFAANYYAGYGKFKRGLLFAVIGFTPLTAIIVNIYAGFKAKKELPIGKQPFKWKMAIGMAVIQMLIAGVVFSLSKDKSSYEIGESQEDNASFVNSPKEDANIVNAESPKKQLKDIINASCINKTLSDNENFSNCMAKAKAGESVSQAEIGSMYFLAKGVEKNDNDAVKWYRKAAKQGYPSAQLHLGMMYKNGFGVSKDYDKAATWFGMAAKQGNLKAKKNLEELDRQINPPSKPDDAISIKDFYIGMTSREVDALGFDCEDSRLLDKMSSVALLLGISETILLPDDEASFLLAALGDYRCDISKYQVAGGYANITLFFFENKKLWLAYFHNIWEVDDMREALRIKHGNPTGVVNTAWGREYEADVWEFEKSTLSSFSGSLALFENDGVDTVLRRRNEIKSEYIKKKQEKMSDL